MLNLNRLEIFVRVAEIGSVSRAAEELRLSQPAVSRAVQKLEQELHGKLLDRVNGRLRLSPFGEYVLSLASRLLDQARTAERELEEVADGTRGEVRFSMAPYLAHVLAAESILRIRADLPSVAVGFSTSSQAGMLEDLKSEKVGFTAGRDARDPDSTFLHCADMRGGIFCAVGHPLATRKSITAADLAQYPLLTGTAWGEILSDSLQEPVALEMAVVSDNIAVLQSVAERSDMLFIGHHGGQFTGLRELTAATHLMPHSVPVGVNVLRGRPMPRATRRAVDLVAATLSDVIPAGSR